MELTPKSEGLTISSLSLEIIVENGRYSEAIFLVKSSAAVVILLTYVS